MGRKGSVPAGTDFMRGTSAETLAGLANKEKDALTARKYAAAYHRKKGRSFKDIAEMLLASYDAVRAWLVAMHKGGVEAAPRRKSPGRPRKIPLDISHALIRDVQRGPQASGVKANSWTYKLLHQRLEDEYGVKMAYSTAAKNFNEMGIRIKIPRPEHPKAASPEERLAFQKAARKEIEEPPRPATTPSLATNAMCRATRTGTRRRGEGGRGRAHVERRARAAESLRRRRTGLGIRHGVRRECQRRGVHQVT